MSTNAAQKVKSMPENSFFKTPLNQADPAIYKGIQDEWHRQQTQIELIASENIASKAVIDSAGHSIY